jgi:magnesium transporter
MSAHKHKRKKTRLYRNPPGSAPGTLSVDPDSPAPKIHAFAFGQDELFDQEIDNADAIREILAKYPVCWINVDGLGDLKTLAKIGEIFSIHQLALEDVVNVHQRAKVDQYGKHLFICAQMVIPGERLSFEQISMFLGANYVLTFQQEKTDALEPVRHRIRNQVEHLSHPKADFLAYTILDTIVDNYFPVLEDYGERLDVLEDEIIEKADRVTLTKMHEVKRDLLNMRRSIWPMREAVTELFRDPTPFISTDTNLYMRDCYDHVVRIMDLVATYRELCSDLMDVYISSVSNRLNEVMKVLTIISTIFIPPTFIAGIYGMNFFSTPSPYNMPELKCYYGYPICLAAMALLTISMLAFLRYKGWLGTMVESSVQAKGEGI